MQKVERIPVLEAENRALKTEVLELKERLSKYENPKNSNNCSVPPSKDENRKTRSLRPKSN